MLAVLSSAGVVWRAIVLVHVEVSPKYESYNPIELSAIRLANASAAFLQLLRHWHHPQSLSHLQHRRIHASACCWSRIRLKSTFAFSLLYLYTLPNHSPFTDALRSIRA
jgi:hypothetical protein